MVENNSGIEPERQGSNKFFCSLVGAPAQLESWGLGGAVLASFGVAQYVTGDPEQAIVSLEKSRQLNAGGGLTDYLLLSLAYRAAGNVSSSKNWYDIAMQAWARQKPRDPDLDRLRAETEAALGIGEAPRGQ